MVDVSVVLPAHNEEQHLPAALRALDAARTRFHGSVEVVVVADRCSDRTADIATTAGAVVVPHEGRGIASVRNAGIRASTGEVVVTVDADCTVHPTALARVAELLADPTVVGGGTLVVPERSSPGIRASYLLVEVLTATTGLAGGMFWARREDLDAIGGFDETVLMGEDLDLARRLRARGRASGRRFVQLRDAPVTASCRKFDRFGDWHMFRMPLEARSVWRSFRGVDTVWVDRYFHEFNGGPDAPGPPPPR